MNMERGGEKIESPGTEESVKEEGILGKHCLGREKKETESQEQRQKRKTSYHRGGESSAEGGKRKTQRGLFVTQ